MKLIAGREVDAAAVDSNVLRITLQSSPKLAEQIQILESWGRFPIQHVVIRSDLSPKLKIRIRAALLAICPEAGVSPALAAFGLERFAPVTYEHYVSEERALRDCEHALYS
jgi:ABC-type phosphate/phosphonate transport system substrate-binding protein